MIQHKQFEEKSITTIITREKRQKTDLLLIWERDHLDTDCLKNKIRGKSVNATVKDVRVPNSTHFLRFVKQQVI